MIKQELKKQVVFFKTKIVFDVIVGETKTLWKTKDGKAIKKEPNWDYTHDCKNGGKAFVVDDAYIQEYQEKQKANDKFQLALAKSIKNTKYLDEEYFRENFKIEDANKLAEALNLLNNTIEEFKSKLG